MYVRFKVMEGQEDQGLQEEQEAQDQENQEEGQVPNAFQPSPILFLSPQNAVVFFEQLQQHHQHLFVQQYYPPMEPLPVLPLALPALPALPVSPVIHGVRRSRSEEEEHPSKRQRIEDGVGACQEEQEQEQEEEQEQEQEQEQDPLHYLLRTGETLYFEEGEPRTILVNKKVEPSLLVRKLLSKVPKGVHARLQYFHKFLKSPQSYTENEEETEYHDSIQEKLMAAYIKESKLRFAFKKVLVRWRVRHMNRTVKEEDECDPITLCPPDKPVVLYDWNFKRKFTFEANTLALHIESKLMYHESGFPMPMYPKSPRNNVEFSYQQLVSLYYQLRAHGELLWAMTTLRQCHFNKKRWYRYHKSAITIAAIKNSVSLLDSVDAIELLSDFIFAKMEELRFQLTRYVTDNYLLAMRRVPQHWYLEKWKYIAMVHYEAEHFGDDRSRYVNHCCFKLFRKQSQFFNELKQMNIIR